MNEYNTFKNENYKSVVALYRRKPEIKKISLDYRRVIRRIEANLYHAQQSGNLDRKHYLEIKRKTIDYRRIREISEALRMEGLPCKQ